MNGLKGERIEERIVLIPVTFAELAQTRLSNDIGDLLFQYDRNNLSKIISLVKDAIKKLEALPTKSKPEKLLKQQINCKLKALLALVQGTYSREDLKVAIGAIMALFS